MATETQETTIVTEREAPRYITRRFRGRMRLEHLIVAEIALGHPLPEGAQVHHVNGDKHDNRPCNLVICQDAAYHTLLHQRDASLAATGRPDMRRCTSCQRWALPADLYLSPRACYHRTCRNDRQNATRKQRCRAGVPGGEAITDRQELRRLKVNLGMVRWNGW